MTCLQATRLPGFLSSPADLGHSGPRNKTRGTKKMVSRQAVEYTAPLLTPGEVAAAFRVDPKTVTRWARAGKLSSIRTLGGHRRFLATEVREILLDIHSSEEPVIPLPRDGGQFRGE